MKKTLILFITISFCLCFMGCNNIKTTKEQRKVIDELNAYLDEIKTNNKVEYSLIFIEIEVEKGIEKATKTKNKNDLFLIKEEILKKINALVLTDSEEVKIKKAYCNRMKNMNPTVNIDENEIKIRYYLGKFDNNYVAVIRNDTRILPYSINDYWYWAGGYIFELLPEFISVYNNNQYYSLLDAYENGLISKQKLDELYSNYQIIVENK